MNSCRKRSPGGGLVLLELLQVDLLDRHELAGLRVESLEDVPEPALAWATYSSILSRDGLFFPCLGARPAGPQAAPRLFHCTGQSNALSLALSTAHCTALLLAAPAGGAWNIILDSRAAFKERVHVQYTRASDSQMRVADRHGARVPGRQRAGQGHPKRPKHGTSLLSERSSDSQRVFIASLAPCVQVYTVGVCTPCLGLGWGRGAPARRRTGGPPPVPAGAAAEISPYNLAVVASTQNI